MLSNSEGNAQWTEGDPFVGVNFSGPNLYWTATAFEDLPEEWAWIANVDWGGRFNELRGRGFVYIWPVRGGQ